MSYFTTSDDETAPFYKVEGWVNRSMPEVVRFTSRMLEAHGVAVRNAGEIGVHHGRFFLLLEQFCDPIGRCDGFDVFEDQFRNADGSGRGSRTRFMENVTRFARAPDRVAAHQVDSIELRAGVYRFERPYTYDLFSVDGCHTALHTCNDLFYAEQTLSSGGVAILDDVNNVSWLGVFEGLCRYLGSPSARLAPFAVGLNKLLLAPVGDHKRYFDHFVAKHGEIAGLTPVKGAPSITSLFGYSVFRYG